MTDATRHETDTEKADRNLNELLQELRVVQTGVQILFAFLLTLPFTQRFAQISPAQKHLYFATLLMAAAASALIIAPVSYHRILFRHHDKRHVVTVSSRLAVAGLVCLALAMTMSILLISDVLFDGLTVMLATGATGLLFGGLWFVIPALRRRHEQDG